jgi:hypothetical protein
MITDSNAGCLFDYLGLGPLIPRHQYVMLLKVLFISQLLKFIGVNGFEDAYQRA